jgi:hypothetical protein
MLVGHIDLEMGARRTRAMLEDLGANPDELRDHIYTEADGRPDGSDLRHLIENGIGVVLVDAAAGAYSTSRLDDANRQDVEQFAEAWIDPLHKAGIATLLIDHVVKNADNRGKWAIGSERKAGQADVHLGLELVGNRPLTRGGQATVKFNVHKDRPGWLTRPTAAELTLASDPGTHRLTWSWRQAASTLANTGDGWRPTIYMERVSRYLETNGPSSKTVIYREVEGKNAVLVQAVSVLLEEEYLIPDGSLLVPAKTFRHIPDDSPIPKPFPAVPDSPLPSSFPSFPPPRGERGTGEDDLDYYEARGHQLGLT